MIGPFESLGRIALAAKEIRLPRRIGGNAGHFIDLALIGHWVDGVRRMRGHHEVNLAGEDQLIRNFGGAIGIGLTVLNDNVNRMGLAANLYACADSFLEFREDEGVGLRKNREWSCRRGHQADLDCAPLSANHRWRHNKGGSRRPCLENPATAQR